MVGAGNSSILIQSLLPTFSLFLPNLEIVHMQNIFFSLSLLPWIFFSLPSLFIHIPIYNIRKYFSHMYTNTCFNNIPHFVSLLEKPTPQISWSSSLIFLFQFSLVYVRTKNLPLLIRVNIKLFLIYLYQEKRNPRATHQVQIKASTVLNTFATTVPPARRALSLFLTSLNLFVLQPDLI